METGHKGIEVTMRIPLVGNWRRQWWVRGALGFYCMKMEIPGLDRIIRLEHE